MHIYICTATKILHYLHTLFALLNFVFIFAATYSLLLNLTYNIKFFCSFFAYNPPRQHNFPRGYKFIKHIEGRRDLSYLHVHICMYILVRK